MMRRRRRDDEDAALETETAPATQPRLTAVDVQQKVFRLAFRGYNERDVDEFLDQVTETLAAVHEENKRLRESLQDAGGAPAALAGAPVQAEEIVRQAREHAAKLVEEAERRAAEIRASVPPTPPAAVSPELPTSFLAKEREFLKRLAAMVQDHARTLKEDVARARPEGGGETERSVAPTSALAFAQRAVEQEDEGRREPAPSAQPSAAEVAAERMPPQSERSEPAGAVPAATPAGPTATSAPPPPASIAGERQGDPRPTSEEPSPEPSIPEAPPDARPERDERSGPWGPAAREPGNEPVPGLRGSDAADRRDADPLISAWESAFLGGGPETDAERASSQSPPDSPEARPEPERAEASEPEKKRAEEPSLKELFWGEQ